MITFTVAGEPFGKKRPRASSFQGHARIHNDPENERYELKVMNAYLMSQGLTQAPSEPLFKEGDYVRAEIVAFFPIPKSFSKKKRGFAEMAVLAPDKKPDLDNIAKSVLDALNGLAYHDDCQVIHMELEKRYAANEPFVQVWLSHYGSERFAK